MVKSINEVALMCFRFDRVVEVLCQLKMLGGPNGSIVFHGMSNQAGGD